MQNHYSSLEEISSFESFVITSHISSYHHKMMYGLPKNFKKIVKNDSKEAFKINAKVYHSTVTGKSLTQKSSELFDDIVDHPEKLKAESQFIKQLKSLKLYPNKEFPIWNEHLELYNTLEKNNFSKGNVVEMYLFLQGNFVINDYKKLINLNFLQQRDYNIFLILFHLDSILFKDNFQNISIYKYLIIGKINGKKKSINHRFWNLVKVIACMESYKKIGISYDFSKGVPKDEDGFSLINEEQAERIKYSVRKLKEKKEGAFYLSHLYQIVGAEKLHQDLSCFNGFSLTGLWLIYIYSIILIRPESMIKNLGIQDLDSIFNVFSTKYKSEGTNQWPSDLSDY
ncbi:hypothetical protein [Alkanindiges illinoisensis]|uniref:hypothetical protein n=1 Tax=Alkanindiges illinoisensis TaxID=197183 RepID=UPI001F0FD9FE|nr:hypothetical protein [Alkanindiges illinoisensis]